MIPESNEFLGICFIQRGQSRSEKRRMEAKRAQAVVFANLQEQCPPICSAVAAQHHWIACIPTCQHHRGWFSVFPTWRQGWGAAKTADKFAAKGPGSPHTNARSRRQDWAVPPPNGKVTTLLQIQFLSLNQRLVLHTQLLVQWGPGKGPRPKANLNARFQIDSENCAF
jgi:hypothetical protein